MINRKFYLHLLLGINFLVPTFNSYFGDARIGNILITALIILVLVCYFLDHDVCLDRVILPFLFMFILWAGVILFNAGLALGRITVRDLFEVIRPFTYFLLFLFGYNFVKFNEDGALHLLRSIMGWLLAIFVIGVIIYYLDSAFSRLILGAYTKDANIASGRISLVYNNPYDYAYGIILLFSYYYIYYIFKGKVSAAFICIAIAISVIFAQSKAGILALTFSFLLCNLFSFVRIFKIRVEYNYLIRLNLIFVISLASIVYLLVTYAHEISYLVNGVLSIVAGEIDTSTALRLGQLNYVMSSVLDYPLRIIFGFGSNKDDAELLENLYILYFYRYGLFGLLLLFYFIIHNSVGLLFKLNDSMDHRLTCLLAALAIWLLTALVAGVGNNVIDQSRIYLVFFMLSGVALCVRK